MMQIATSIGVVLIHFFFQAEDGIRDRNVTGVQTCALPISQIQRPAVDQLAYVLALNVLHDDKVDATNFVEIEDRADVRMIERGGQASFALKTRSEERRVGKECRSRWSA